MKAKKSEESEGSTCNAHVERNNTASLYQTCLKVKVLDVIHALKKQQKPIVGGIFATLTHLVMTKLGHVCLIVSLPPCHVATIPRINYTETTEGAVYKFALNGNRIKEVFSTTRKLWTDLTMPILKWIASITIKGTSAETSDSYQKPTITEIDGKYQKCSNESMGWSNVYDIVNAGPRNRFTIKTNAGHLIVHNCGYGGGVAAFLTFALAYGLDLDELAEAALPNIPPGVKREAMRWYQQSVETDKTYGLSEKIFVTCDSLKRMWRNAHPQTVSFWYDIEEAVKNAIQVPNIPFKCRKLTVRRDKAWLRIFLPSGRSICYPSARIENGQITYMGINPYSRKWERLKTYGGKLCLAKGTLVLTITGWMPIEIVSQDAYVWDGIEWVRTDGSVFNGNQEVIQAYGVWMTADHQVLTEKGWKSASQSKRYNRSSCRLPDGYELSRFRRKEISLESTLHLWTRNTHSSNIITKTKKKRYNCLLRMPKGTNNIMQEPKARNVKTPRFCRMEPHVSQMYSPFRQSMAKLWWSGNNGLQTLAKKFQQFLGRHGQNIPTRLIFRSHQQQCRLPPQKLPLGYVASTSSKYSTSSIRANSPRHNEYTGIGSPNRDCFKHALLSPGKKGKSSTTSGTPQHIAEVYDLINCGPRNRFVIATPDGPLIVHNCENICQAAARDVLAYNMPPIEKAGFEIVLTVHDEIISEAPDTPQFSAEGLSTLLSLNPDWAFDLPLSAAGFETYRYRKE
ncbi:hypothetical protein [Candidatus Hamiltonella defensa]|uniref:hypothetical protein n=1 Tax=Candidatus Williamhamiltonella defendens TaxID=138072 RepID=UPI001F406950|nr:hypothetical protein [Candidatus Hamiltonella defensa]